MASHDCDLLIIGAGPAGLYAAYYAGFRGWSVAVVDALPEIGGQVTAMYPEKHIFDVAGFASILGRDLIAGLTTQAASANPSYILGQRAVNLSSDDNGVTVTTETGTQIHTKAVLITGGIGAFTPRPLPAATAWSGEGIVNFVPRLADHADRDIVIVGGGDSAFDWAVSLHPIARSVTLVHRRPQFRAHAGTIDLVRSLGIEILTPYEVTALRNADGGSNGDLASIEITSKDGSEVRQLPAQTVVAALGFIADISDLASWGMQIEGRHISVDTAMRTSLPRVFAAGDIATYPGKVPLISVGFGEAALAVNNATTWIEPNASLFPGHSSGGSAD